MSKNDMKFEKSIPFMIYRLYWVIQLSVNRIFANASINITMEQFLLMNYLWKNDGNSQQELAAITGKDKAGIARLLDQLSRKGLVERVPDIIDRRIKRVVVTEEGRAIHQSCQLKGNQNRQDAEKGISERDLDITRRTLEKILKNMQIKMELSK